MVKAYWGVVVMGGSLALLLPGCGSAQASGSVGGTSSEPGSPGEKCLRTANAAREKHAAEPSKIMLKHLVVAHKASKTLSSGVSRSREQACLRAAKARDEIRGGADFDSVASKYSDDPQTIKHNVQREDVLPQFGDAAFDLEVFQLSDVVETDDGFHVILRLE